MKNILMFLLSLAMAAFFIVYSLNSSQIKAQSIKTEQTIQSAASAFVDRVSDTGALTFKDYNQLQSQLSGTGAAFNIAITVSRLYPVPDPSVPDSYILDYKPAYGWTSEQGGLSQNYVDPNWQVPVNGPAPKGVQYFVKADNFSVTIKQVDAFPYQRTLTSRMRGSANLGTWSFSKAVRDSGNAIVGNQPEPLE